MGREDALIGTWKLVSAVDTTEKGETEETFGSNPTGFLTYMADGRMMGIISNGGRKPLSVADDIAAPAAERAEAFATFAAYAGRYTLSEDQVTHHVEAAWLQNLVGTDLKRTIVSLAGDRLVLGAPPWPKGGKMVTSELVWERITDGTKSVK